MRHSELAAFIDHTLLKADATQAMVEALCHEAIEHSFYAVCLNGSHVATARRILGTSAVKIAAVVGFPLGAMRTEAKAFETGLAVNDGAHEIDMVMRVDLAKIGDFQGVENDIRAVTKAAGAGTLVKVILETSLLNHDQIVACARASEHAGAHFIKTSTGFSTAGQPAGIATVEHITLMKNSVGPQMKIKASGGIRDFKTAMAMINAGATRLGTSSGVNLVSGQIGNTGY